jgi:hypothetical protein
MIQLGLAITGFIAVKYLSQPYPYIVGILLIGLSGWHSVMELEKRLGLLSILKNFKSK